MKLIVKKGMTASIFLSLLMTSAYAHSPQIIKSTVITTPGRFYMGVFGGGAWTRSFDVSQYGTAFYFEAAGGPLAVNAFGDTNNRFTWLLGAQVGYQAPGIMLNPCTRWMLVPAAELEAYYLDKKTFDGDLTNDEATRLTEHDFNVSYQIRRSIFLANAIFNLNIPCVRFHPYLGVGFGGAVVKITGADAIQIAPPEPGVNHYNSNTGDIDPTFAGQIKVGVSYALNNCVDLFAEYRWLYLASTRFSFGSTVYPGHPVTSGWQVRLDPQYINIATVGVRLSFL